METRLPIHLVVWACLLAIFSPKRFLVFQQVKLKALGISVSSNEVSVYLIYRTFWLSLMLVIVSGVFGWIAGILAGQAFGFASARLIGLLQITGTSFLLWGTLFVRGWDIQTYNGQTLIECVNRWLYLTLCCFGTAVLVASLIWPTE